MTANFSISKLNIYQVCSRKYYFSEMGSHGKANLLRRKVFELKKVQNLQMWRGSVVDLAMEKLIIPLISEKKELDFEEIVNQAIEIAKRQYEFSKTKQYREFSKNNIGDDYCVLEVHELNKPYSQDDISQVYEGIKKSVLNISQIQMPNRDISLLAFLYKAKKLIPNISNWRVEVEDMGVKPQIDLLLYDENFKPTVIDWKVSESFTSDYSNQLEICALTVYLKRLEKIDSTKYDYDDIQLYEVNLWQSKVKKHEFSEAIYHKVYDKIHLSISDIELLNASKEEFKFQKNSDSILDLNIENYDTTDNSGSCMLCNYKSLCQFLIRNNNQYNEKQYLEFVQNN